MLGTGSCLVDSCRPRPQVAGAAALILMALDLAAANSRYVMTVEQSMLDGQPMLVKTIEKAEAERNPPSPAHSACIECPRGAR